MTPTEVLERLGATWGELISLVPSAVGVYLAVIVLTRLTGVRALAMQYLVATLRRRNLLGGAVVMETTGDISVLRTADRVDPELLEGVRGAEALS